MTGFRIATATGFTSPTTVGRGLATSLGDGRRITTAAGSPMARDGRGGLVRFTGAGSTARSGRRLTCRSGDGAAALGFGVGWGGWGGFGWLPIGPCDYYHPWWGGYRGRFGWAGRGGYNRYGGFAPLHGGTRFSNIAHMNDAHIGRAMSTVNAGRFGAGRVTAVAATRAQIGWSAHDGGQSARGSVARQLVGERTRGSALHGAQQVRSISSDRCITTFRGQRRSSSRLQVCGRRCSRIMWARFRLAAARVLANPPERAARHAEAERGRECGHDAQLGESQSRGQRAFNANRSRLHSAPNSGSVPESRAFGSEHRLREHGLARTNAGFQKCGSAARHQRSALAANRDGFRPFTPPSQQRQARARRSRRDRADQRQRGSSGGYWNRTAPSSSWDRAAAVRTRAATGGDHRRVRSWICGSRSRGRHRMVGYRAGADGGYGGYHARQAQLWRFAWRAELWISELRRLSRPRATVGPSAHRATVVAAVWWRRPSPRV